jgi:hypothetical protein
MACDECSRLQQEETDALQSVQSHRTMNLQMGLDGKEDKKVEQRLREVYDLACAKNRLHKGNVHKDEGHRVSLEDLNVVLRQGRTSP